VPKTAPQTFIEMFYVAEMRLTGFFVTLLLASLKTSYAQPPALASVLLNNSDALKAGLDTVKANRETIHRCMNLKKLEKLEDATLGSKTTPEMEPIIGNTPNVGPQEHLTKATEKAELELQLLRSNSTLMALCAGELGLQHEQQQSGMIGNRKSICHLFLEHYSDVRVEAIDNSGAISFSTSSATAHVLDDRSELYVLAITLSTVFITL
jgi:hypothetical protein